MDEKRKTGVYVKSAEEWWQRLPDCLRVAIFYDFWDITEVDRQGKETTAKK